MELQDFVQHFAEQFDETEMSVFKPDTKFREINEWSSLLALSIIAMADEEYEVKLKGEDIRTSPPIEDLFNIVKTRV